MLQILKSQCIGYTILFYSFFSLDKKFGGDKVKGAYYTQLQYVSKVTSNTSLWEKYYS